MSKSPQLKGSPDPEPATGAPCPLDLLTWHRDGNAIEYRLNGVLIERLLDHPLDRRPLRVTAAIRRFAPRTSSYEAAVAIWSNRVEGDSPLSAGGAARLARRKERDQTEQESSIGRGPIRNNEAEDRLAPYTLALPRSGSRKPNLDEQERRSK